MPEFLMEGKSAPEFKALDSFTQGYIEALFFTETETGTTRETWDPETQSALPGDVGFDDLAAEALESIIADCKRFQETYPELLDKAYGYTADGLEYTPNRAGHDFWLTRNGHGAGFWSRTWKDADGNADDAMGDALGDLCGHNADDFGPVDVYLGDDGKVYAS